MKLYYAPGACSLSPHIIIRELNANVQLEKVDLSNHTTESGVNFFSINPRGQVPVLELENGEILTEGPIITQYIAESVGPSSAYPSPLTIARYRVHEWQNYVTSELHKSFTPLFNANFDKKSKDLHADILKKKYEWLDSKLQQSSYLTGPDFTIADSYLFTVTNWASHVGVDLSEFKTLQDYMGRVASRVAVKEALKAEGLV